MIARLVLGVVAAGLVAAAAWSGSVLQAKHDAGAWTELRRLCENGCRGITQADGTTIFMREADALQIFGEQCAPSRDEPARKQIWRL